MTFTRLRTSCRSAATKTPPRSFSLSNTPTTTRRCWRSTPWRRRCRTDSWVLSTGASQTRFRSVGARSARDESHARHQFGDEVRSTPRREPRRRAGGAASGRRSRDKGAQIGDGLTETARSVERAAWIGPMAVLGFNLLPLPVIFFVFSKSDRRGPRDGDCSRHPRPAAAPAAAWLS